METKGTHFGVVQKLTYRIRAFPLRRRFHFTKKLFLYSQCVGVGFSWKVLYSLHLLHHRLDQQGIRLTGFTPLPKPKCGMKEVGISTMNLTPLAGNKHSPEGRRKTKPIKKFLGFQLFLWNSTQINSLRFFLRTNNYQASPITIPLPNP